MTLFEAATRVPFIIRAPFVEGSAGTTTWALTEMVDLYPTLVDLAGLPAPKSLGEDINGTSLVPLLRNPLASVKDAAFSQFAKCGPRCPNTCWMRKDCPANCYALKTCPVSTTACERV